MRLQLELRSVTPLLCHNGQGADPTNPFAEAKQPFTSKRRKTEDDQREIDRLDWFSGLYEAPGVNGPAMPTANLRKCLIEAAKVHRLGKQVGRAVLFTDLAVPITYDGPRDPAALYVLPQHVSRLPVRVGTSRIARVRPCFPQWAMVAGLELIESVLDLGDLGRIVDLAGRIEGLGDNRVNGYGRFDGKVVEL